jgi:hypothetical protein
MYACSVGARSCGITGSRFFVLKMRWMRTLASDCGTQRVTPFQGCLSIFPVTQGVALGYRVAAPLGRTSIPSWDTLVCSPEGATPLAIRRVVARARCTQSNVTHGVARRRRLTPRDIDLDNPVLRHLGTVNRI